MFFDPPGSRMGGFFGLTQITRKVFVSYHHGGDQAYYDAFSRTFHDGYEAIYDNSLERRIDSENVDYVRQRIYDKHIKGSSCTLVLVGWHTWGRKYVDWEIDATLEKEHGLIAVRLPTGTNALMPWRLFDNILTGYAVSITWEQLTHSPTALQWFVEQANARPKYLINNSRPRRYRNEPLL